MRAIAYALVAQTQRIEAKNRRAGAKCSATASAHCVLSPMGLAGVAKLKAPQLELQHAQETAAWQCPVWPHAPADIHVSLPAMQSAAQHYTDGTPAYGTACLAALDYHILIATVKQFPAVVQPPMLCWQIYS